MQSKGGTEGTIDEATKWAKRLYSGAKFFGKVPQGYENLDIDQLADNAKDLLGVRKNPRVGFDATKYGNPSYSRRSDELPD